MEVDANDIERNMRKVGHDLREAMHHGDLGVLRVVKMVQEAVSGLSRKYGEQAKQLLDLQETALKLRDEVKQLTEDLKVLAASRLEEDVPVGRPKRRCSSDRQTVSFERDAAGKISHAHVTDDDDE